VPHRSWILAAGLALVASGCAHRTPGEVPPAGAPVRVEVKNNYALPMEVHVLAEGADHRLGTVHPGMSGRFTIPPGLVGNGNIVLEAYPGRRTPVARTGALLVSPGDIVTFDIGAEPFNSPATVVTPSKPKD
jgi:hypothetical protein